jgi:3-phenylpropionate/cinnamic acid dioxygenase small subunit
MSTSETVEQFIYREVSLLDRGLLWEWLELFSDDGRYWVPCNRDDSDPKSQVAIMYETRVGLARRITRMERGRAVQEVSSRTCHAVTNIRVRRDEEVSADQGPRSGVVVDAVMVIHETNRQRSQLFPGHCTYHLTPAGASWQIALKKLSLIDNDQYYEDLSFLF